MDDAASWIVVDKTLLSTNALNGLIEEFVNRDGTDYGAQEQSLDAKKTQILHQLQRGDVIILFDERSETCNLINRRDWQEIVESLE